MSAPLDTGPLITLTAQGNGTVNGTDQQNAQAMGIKVVVDITVITAGSLTVTIQGKDPTSGKYYTLLASAALAAVATTILTVFPGAAVTANLSANDMLPANWRVIAVAVTGPITATIAASLLAG